MAAEENSALRSDLESAKQFIAEREKGDGNGELDLVERRALEVQRRLEEAQEEMIMFEHQREDDKIRLDVSLREADEWRQVCHFNFFHSPSALTCSIFIKISFISVITRVLQAGK